MEVRLAGQRPVIRRIIMQVPAAAALVVLATAADVSIQAQIRPAARLRQVDAVIQILRLPVAMAGTGRHGHTPAWRSTPGEEVAQHT